jgi:raffinose/stachyose/melibiose transport system permease protein
MAARRRSGGFLFDLPPLAVFGLLALSTLYPLVWLALNSFKTTNEMFDNTWLPPAVWQWQNYVHAWKFGISRYLFNSIVITAISVLLIVFLGALSAYALAVLRIPGRKWIYLFILGGSILPPEVSLFPLFKVLVALGVYDTYMALILPYVAFGLPFATFLIRAHMVTIPRDLHEAANIDGARPFAAFWRIYVPLSQPALASVAFIQIMRVWNEYIFALTFVESDRVKPLTVGIAAFASNVTTDWATLMAGLVISILPIIVLFLLLQRQFVQGLTQGTGK